MSRVCKHLVSRVRRIFGPQGNGGPKPSRTNTLGTRVNRLLPCSPSNASCDTFGSALYGSVNILPCKVPIRRPLTDLWFRARTVVPNRLGCPTTLPHLGLSVVEKKKKRKEQRRKGDNARTHTHPIITSPKAVMVSREVGASIPADTEHVSCAAGFCFNPK